MSAPKQKHPSLILIILRNQVVESNMTTESRVWQLVWRMVKEAPLCSWLCGRTCVRRRAVVAARRINVYFRYRDPHGGEEVQWQPWCSVETPYDGWRYEQVSVHDGVVCGALRRPSLLTDRSDVGDHADMAIRSHIEPSLFGAKRRTHFWLP